MEHMPFIAAFLGGVLAFFSPCVLPLLPAYLSMVSGVSLDEMVKQGDNKWKVRRLLLLNAGFFSAGFTVVFVLLGASATFLGKFLLAHLQVISKIAGVVIIILGLHITGLFRIKYLYYERRIQMHQKPVGVGWSLLGGMAFAFGWTPCIGPILAGILVYAATEETMMKGIILLSLFSLGMAIPFLGTALLFDLFRKIPLTSGIVRNFEIVAGIFLILVGILVFSNEFQSVGSGFTSWLSDALQWIEILEKKILNLT